MYNNRSEEEIKRDMLSNIKNTTDKTENSLVHDALSPAAIEFMNAYVKLEYIAEKINLDNLEGLELESFIFQRTGLPRRLSTKSTTLLTISGTEGTVVKKEDVFSTEDEINFLSKYDYVISETGLIQIEVECEESGSTGNVPSNTIVKTKVTGIVDVYNEKEVVNGYDDETDNSIRKRYYEKLQRPAKSGNKYHYEQWAKEVEGVGDVKVISRWNGPLTVKAIIVDMNKRIANEELVAKTFSHIEAQRPFGANITVVSADEKSIDISVDLTLLSDYGDLQVKEIIRQNLTEHLKSVAFRTQYISYAKIGSIILDSEGVIDYSNLIVNLGTYNIEILENEVAIIGSVV